VPYGRLTCTKCKQPLQENEAYEFLTSFGDGWFEWLSNHNKLGTDLDTSGLSCACEDMEGATVEIQHVALKFTRMIDE
jgi:hypothetical protein